MKIKEARPCLKCQVPHQGKYPVCSPCLEGINTEWTVNAQQALKRLYVPEVA